MFQGCLFVVEIPGLLPYLSALHSDKALIVPEFGLKCGVGQWGPWPEPTELFDPSLPPTRESLSLLASGIVELSLDPADCLAEGSSLQLEVHYPLLGKGEALSRGVC